MLTSGFLRAGYVIFTDCFEGSRLILLPFRFDSQVYEHQDGSKSLKLGDFGLATVVDGPLYTVCGTPTYVAPEIIAETG